MNNIIKQEIATAIMLIYFIFVIGMIISTFANIIAIFLEIMKRGS